MPKIGNDYTIKRRTGKHTGKHTFLIGRKFKLVMLSKLGNLKGYLYDQFGNLQETLITIYPNEV